MAINDRIQQIIDRFYFGNTRGFAFAINANYQTIRNIVGERKSIPSSTILEHIINSIEQINSDWLLTGQGEMLKPTENNSRNVHNEGSISGSVSTGNNHTSINGGLSVGNDSTSKSSDNEQRILLLENEVKYLNELLAEKERIIQVLLKNS